MPLHVLPELCRVRDENVPPTHIDENWEKEQIIDAVAPKVGWKGW